MRAKSAETDNADIETAKFFRENAISNFLILIIQIELKIDF